jgi:hypothetical protein
MTASRRIGPLVAYGPLYGAPAQGMPEYAADAGPGIHYQGWSIPDLRAVNQKDYGIQGAMPAHLTNPRILSVDITPIALGTAKVAALQNVPAGLTLTFAAIGSGFSTGVSIVNAATGQIVTGLAALDFGFGLISTTSGSTTITPASGTMDFYYPGQWLCIPRRLRGRVHDRRLDGAGRHLLDHPRRLGLAARLGRRLPGQRGPARRVALSERRLRRHARPGPGGRSRGLDHRLRLLGGPELHRARL